MIKIIKNRWTIGLLILFLGLAFEGNQEVRATEGVCSSAAEMGVCRGDGAKCTIKKGWLSWDCGKSPDGQSIIMENEE